MVGPHELAALSYHHSSTSETGVPAAPRAEGLPQRAGITDTNMEVPPVDHLYLCRCWAAAQEGGQCWGAPEGAQTSMQSLPRPLVLGLPLWALQTGERGCLRALCWVLDWVLPIPLFLCPLCRRGKTGFKGSLKGSCPSGTAVMGNRKLSQAWSVRLLGPTQLSFRSSPEGMIW